MSGLALAADGHLTYFRTAQGDERASGVLMNRKVTLGEQPKRFLETYERKLHRITVFNDEAIQRAAAVLIAVVRGLEVCRFHIEPKAQGNDSCRLGYTLYTFADEEVEGRYSCNGEHVYLYHLSFTAAVLSGRIMTLAVRAA